MSLQNKIDFALVFSATNANPNGDPLGGNRPRTTGDGLGEVSDVCLKRKLRNRLQDGGQNLFVQSEERKDDDSKSLSERFNKYLKQLSKEAQKDRLTLFSKVCEQWFDVRAFGQVFAFKKGEGVDEVSLGVRGPFTIQSAFSVEPVAVESIQITKSVNSETTANGQKSSDTMGMKHRIAGKAVYVTFGSISPQLAEKTGFSDEDAQAIKTALTTLFEADESSARPSGSMEVIKIIWFKHDSNLGQYSSAKVHRSVKVDKFGNVSVDKERISGLDFEEIEG